jgi:phospho-N-acetylmuramoyl-pentapeptide-transferase
MWRRISRNQNIPNEKITEFMKINDGVAETSTPRTGGMIVWITVILIVALFGIIGFVFNSESTEKLNFISRNQTLLPFFTLIVASLIGLGDDFLQIFGKGKWTTDPIVLRIIKIGIIFRIFLRN